jgi:hypothetical protein
MVFLVLRPGAAHGQLPRQFGGVSRFPLPLPPGEGKGEGLAGVERRRALLLCGYGAREALRFRVCGLVLYRTYDTLQLTTDAVELELLGIKFRATCEVSSRTTWLMPGYFILQPFAETNDDAYFTSTSFLVENHLYAIVKHHGLIDHVRIQSTSTDCRECTALHVP